jgi:prevent-host-death family protein
MNKITISKSEFKPKALHYFRLVQKSGTEIIISDHGKPVAKIIPYSDNSEDILKSLRNSVKKYIDPTEPVGLPDWEILK